MVLEDCTFSYSVVPFGIGHALEVQYTLIARGDGQCLCELICELCTAVHADPVQGFVTAATTAAAVPFESDKIDAFMLSSTSVSLKTEPVSY